MFVSRVRLNERILFVNSQFHILGLYMQMNQEHNPIYFWSFLFNQYQRQRRVKRESVCMWQKKNLCHDPNITKLLQSLWLFFCGSLYNIIYDIRGIIKTSIVSYLPVRDVRLWIAVEFYLIWNKILTDSFIFFILWGFLTDCQ